jgi:AbrB family looped-hinge helix DNA binding protein
METTTLSTKYQLVLPRGARTQLRLKPGMKFTVLLKGNVIYLVPERPLSALRGVAAGGGVREPTDRTERS